MFYFLQCLNSGANTENYCQTWRAIEIRSSDSEFIGHRICPFCQIHSNGLRWMWTTVWIVRRLQRSLFVHTWSVGNMELLQFGIGDTVRCTRSFKISWERRPFQVSFPLDLCSFSLALLFDIFFNPIWIIAILLFQVCGVLQMLFIVKQIEISYSANTFTRWRFIFVYNLQQRMQEFAFAVKPPKKSHSNQLSALQQSHNSLKFWTACTNNTRMHPKYQTKIHRQNRCNRQQKEIQWKAYTTEQFNDPEKCTGKLNFEKFQNRFVFENTTGTAKHLISFSFFHEFRRSL